MPKELSDLWDTLSAANPNIPLPKLIGMLRDAMNHYAEIAKPHMATRESRMNLAYTFETEIDKVVENLPQDGKDLIKCRKGCSHCCKMRVVVSKAEAELLLAIAEEKGIKLDKDYMHKQMMLTESSYSKTTQYSRCVFLDKDETCMVYEHRPIACRKYLVSTKPKYCNIQKFPKHRVASLFMADAEAIEGGLSIVDEFVDYSLPQALLIVMEENGK